MLPLKAHVKNGRLVLDDPTTDLPEGSEVELVVVDDEFDPEERARLLEAIEAGAADIARGDYVDGTDFANQLLSRREPLRSRRVVPAPSPEQPSLPP